MDILSTRIYQGCVCHMAVTSIIASTFSRRTLFITRPIKLKVGMQDQTFCSSPAALHLFQNCLDLASMLCIGKVGDTAWRQIDLLLGFLRVWLFLDKLSDEVSSWMSVLHSWTPSLLWH